MPKNDEAFQIETKKLERECGKLEAEWIELKEQTRAAKKAYDKAIDALRGRVRGDSVGDDGDGE